MIRIAFIITFLVGGWVGVYKVVTWIFNLHNFNEVLYYSFIGAGSLIGLIVLMFVIAFIVGIVEGIKYKNKPNFHSNK